MFYWLISIDRRTGLFLYLFFIVRFLFFDDCDVVSESVIFGDFYLLNLLAWKDLVFH